MPLTKPAPLRASGPWASLAEVAAHAIALSESQRGPSAVLATRRATVRMRTALKLALAAPCAFVVYAVLAYTYTAHHRVGPRNPFAARAATPGHIPQWLIKTGTPQRARTPDEQNPGHRARARAAHPPRAHPPLAQVCYSHV